MHSSTVILSTLGLAASVLASSHYTLPAGFNIGLVQPDELNAWCQGQRNVCPSICKSGTKVNYCDPTTLNFECTCADGSTPDVGQYIQTVPFFVCQANYGQCINAHPNDANGQRACKQAANCGSKNASAIEEAASSSAAASSTMAMATHTGSSSTTSSTTSSSATAKSTATNAAIALGEQYSTGVLATVMFLAAHMFL